MKLLVENDSVHLSALCKKVTGSGLLILAEERRRRGRPRVRRKHRVGDYMKEVGITREKRCIIELGVELAWRSFSMTTQDI